MAQNSISFKQIAIDKANGTIVVITAAACFIVIFSLVSSFALLSQMHYQGKVISRKKQTLAQLKTDISSGNQLVESYKSFVSTSQNVLGGDPNGTGAQDGDNGRIVLDALPSKYDFPALATSLEKVLTAQGVKISSIEGTDDEVAQSANTGSTTPQAVAIPFQFEVTGDYSAIQNVVSALDKSIRPMQVQTMDVSGGTTDLTLTVTAQTYYQPSKQLNISKQAL